MTLSWIFLGSGQTGISRPEDVPASMIREMKTVAEHKGGKIGSLDVALHLHNGGCCGASYEIQSLKSSRCAATVFTCWGQAGCEHWWHTAVERQEGNAQDPGIPCACTQTEHPRLPWLALAEFSGEGSLTAEQIDLELATAWALISLHGDKNMPEVQAVNHYIGETEQLEIPPGC